MRDRQRVVVPALRRRRCWRPLRRRLRRRGDRLRSLPRPPAPSPQSPGAPARRNSRLATAGSRYARGRHRPQRRKRVPLGPTPHYPYIPRWGLYDRFDDDGAAGQVAAERSAPSPASVRSHHRHHHGAAGDRGFALLHVIRYALLLINRTVLLHPMVAALATWLPVGGQRGGDWLRGRDGGHRPGADQLADRPPRRGLRPPRRALIPARPGNCGPVALVPVVNLVMAPVFVIELARAEQRIAGCASSAGGSPGSSVTRWSIASIADHRC